MPFSSESQFPILPHTCSELEVLRAWTAAFAVDMANPFTCASEFEALQHAATHGFCRPCAARSSGGTLNEGIQHLLQDGVFPDCTGWLVFHHHFHPSQTSDSHQERSSGSHKVYQLHRCISLFALVVVPGIALAIDGVQHHEGRARWPHHQQASLSQTEHQM